MSFPKCPHCGYEFDSENIYYSGSTNFPTESDGDTEETKCLSCTKPLIIQLDLTPSWRFIDEYGEDIE